jgi:hypothetical protein
MTEEELYVNFYATLERVFGGLAERINEQGLSFVHAKAERTVRWPATEGEETTLSLHVAFWTHPLKEDSPPYLRSEPAAINVVRYVVEVGKLTLDLEDWGDTASQAASLPLRIYNGAFRLVVPGGLQPLAEFVEESINKKLWDLHTRHQTVVVGLKLS